MPIYEYACEFCDKHVDELQKVSDPPLTVCPACGKPGLHRLLSAPAFQLKGSGWYVTDFRGDKKDKPAEKSSADKKDTSSTKTTEVKTESATSSTLKTTSTDSKD